MPNMREKVIKYITELDEEIKRLQKWIDDNFQDEIQETIVTMIARLTALSEVRNDLKNRLEEEYNSLKLTIDSDYFSNLYLR
ncbi:hypothetical protein [Anaerovorax sp. IOR16]|uniref:hypothetical protein n=1 Tax=Anaerovorax sp. IOR16 TaxID=2773458 RepID=UPI0019D21435|nr:hypothetical protein [Anaerovorax sp. IOR16]